MRKNILIFGHSYGPQFIDISNQYSQLFDKKTHSVTVVYLVGEPSADIRLRHCADEVIFLNAPKSVTRGLKIEAIKKMLQMTREKNFSIIICHRYKPTYIMLWVARFQKIPALFFIMHELGTLKSIARKLLIAALARKNMIFGGVSNAVRDDMRRDIWRVPSARVITLYNMIDVELTESKLLNREAARAELKLSADDFVFGNIGRLVKNKDQKTLINSFAAIQAQCPNAKLLIAGSGNLEQELKHLVQELKITDSVIFTGFLLDAFSYMKAFDVYISSSTQEAFGRVLIEAMVAQVPIIATKVNGVPEVIGDTGPLVLAGDSATLAKEMFKAYEDKATLSAWGMRGYQRAVKEFSQRKFHEIFWNLPLLRSNLNSTHLDC